MRLQGGVPSRIRATANSSAVSHVSLCLGPATNHKSNGVKLLDSGFETYFAPEGAGFQNTPITVFGRHLKKRRGVIMCGLLAEDGNQLQGILGLYV